MTTLKLPNSKYPSTYYRVSLKAVVTNDAGKVLCVKEKGSDWTLPGGGLDHGETIAQGLAREMDEEIGIGDASFTYEPVGADTMYVPSKNTWQVWLLYRVVFSSDVDFTTPGVDGDDIAFIDPHQFRDGDTRAKRLIYKWCVDPSQVSVRGSIV